MFGLLENSTYLRYSDTSKKKNPINSIHFIPKMASQGTPENDAILLMRN